MQEHSLIGSMAKERDGTWCYRTSGPVRYIEVQDMRCVIWNQISVIVSIAWKKPKAYSTDTLLLKLWFYDQQDGYYLGACSNLDYKTPPN